MTEQKVRFLLHDEPRGVRRADVFGLIYFHAAAAPAESPMTIVDAAGSRWAAASLKLGADAVEFAAPGGRTGRVGLSEIAKIDLSCGKIVYLSDLKPDVERVEPCDFTVTGERVRQPPGLLSAPPRSEFRIEVAADPRPGLP